MGSHGHVVSHYGGGARGPCVFSPLCLQPSAHHQAEFIAPPLDLAWPCGFTLGNRLWEKGWGTRSKPGTHGSAVSALGLSDSETAMLWGSLV